MRIPTLMGMTLLLLLVAACRPTKTLSEADIARFVEATISARDAIDLSPQLLDPADQSVFDNPAQVMLHWQWARELQQGEFFDVRVWREGEPDFGITWSQDTTFALAQWLSQQEAGEFLWTIAAIAGQDGTIEAVLGAAPPPRRFTVRSTVLPTATPDVISVNRIMRLPDGFEAQVYAHLEQSPAAISAIDFTGAGDMLVLHVDGRLIRLRDVDGDGVADEQQQILFNDDDSPVNLTWAAGMAIHDDGRVFVADSGRIGYLLDADGDGIYDGHQSIIEGLPSLVYPLHSNNGLLFDAAGKLYVAVGSTSDHGPLREELEASILRMNDDGSEAEVFATGFRNPYDLTIASDGRIFAGDNAPDMLDDEMPFYPPEELNYVREGRDYGFPDVYGNGIAIREHEGEAEPPVALFRTSSVTVGVAYYEAQQFPPQYRDGVFVAQFGGFTGEGKKVVFVPLQATAGGGYSGQVERFINFINGHHPIDVRVGPDGALYVAEYSKGFILRISYTGQARRDD